MVVDLALALAAALEELDADRAEGLASKWLNVYQRLGGSTMTMAGARQRVREILAAVEWT